MRLPCASRYRISPVEDHTSVRYSLIVRALPALALLSVGCSLLAPEDAFFVGGVSGAAGGSLELPCEPAPPCGSYPEPDETLTPSDVGSLPELVKKAGYTIGLTEGTYQLDQPLEVVADGVTLRATAGPVVIQGAWPTLVTIYSSDVTLADLTLTGSDQAAVVLSPPSGQRSERARLCNVTIQDGGERFVSAIEGGGYADCVLIEGSTFALTGHDPAVSPACCPGCIPMAVRVGSGRGWVIRGNHFAGFYCQDANGSCVGSPIVLTFLFGSRDTLIENNQIEDASRGIVLGYTKEDKPTRTYADAPHGGVGIDHYDGIIRNNTIAGHPICFDTGIELNRAAEPRVLHNTIVHRGMLNYATIDRRYSTTYAYIDNNLVLGPIRFRECGTGTCGVLRNNHEIPDPLLLPSYFVDPMSDFHLVPDAAPAIDQGVVVEDAGVDLDGTPHDAGAPDIGADELR